MRQRSFSTQRAQSVAQHADVQLFFVRECMRGLFASACASAASARSAHKVWHNMLTCSFSLCASACVVCARVHAPAQLQHAARARGGSKCLSCLTRSQAVATKHFEAFLQRVCFYTDACMRSAPSSRSTATACMHGYSMHTVRTA